MSLKETIIEDMKAAMRAKDKLKLGTIRMLLAAVKQREIDERIELTDSAILTVINKMIKQRRDASEQFSNAQRQELADKEDAEIIVLQDYLPQQLTADEVQSAIKDAISKTGATSMKDMGKVMGLLKSELEGRTDMGKVSGHVKTQLTG
jgi:uncharacterized protein